MQRRLAKHRCPGCEIRKALCFCDAIPHLSLQTRVVILMHVSEEVLTTNTAKLASKALTNCEIRIRGRKGNPLETAGLVPSGGQAVMLYPSPHAAEFSVEFASRLARPVTVIVPDGSWAQARRMVRREPALAGIPHVKLPPGPPSEYRLRVQRSAMDLCTLEAIARAIGILESHEAQGRLEALLRVMVERTLWSRGTLAADECRHAVIPEAAF
jgi:DTW domain-containing protein YfiP